MRNASAAGVLLAALFLCPPAAADEDARNEQADEPAEALIAGSGITFVSLAVGGVMIARGSNEFVKNGGLIGAQSGMVLAPLAAHAIVGETKRGAWWSAALLVPLATNSVLIGLFPSLIKHADAGIQYVSFISFTLSIVGGTLGVLDAVRVGERKPKRAAASSFSIAPLLGGGTTGAMISGSL